MGRFTQQELMNASKLARNSAAKNTSSDEGGDIETVSKPRPFDDTEHPFSGNDNNRRVAERIAKEGGKTAAPVIEIKPAHLVAAEDLDKADEMDANSASLSEDEQNAQSQATIAAGLGKGEGAATVLKPLTPAQKKKADEAAAAAAIAASAGGVPPVPVFNG